MAGRLIAGNGRPVTAWIFGPDAHGVHIATGMAVYTNTFSPAAAGVHSPGASPRGFVGDRGYGVNRFAGRLPYALQGFAGAVAPIRDPGSRRLGAGAGASGQPGMPSTGTDTTGYGPIAWLGYGQLRQVGLGG